MAINTTVSLSIVKSEQRTWRANIESPKGGDYVLTAWRENIGYDAQGGRLSRTDAPTVTRSAAAMAAAKEPPFVCSDGTEISVAHLIESVSGLIDRWAVADAERVPAPAA
jgi:hypothetical protein